MCRQCILNSRIFEHGKGYIVYVTLPKKYLRPQSHLIIHESCQSKRSWCGNQAYFCISYVRVVLSRMHIVKKNIYVKVVDSIGKRLDMRGMWESDVQQKLLSGLLSLDVPSRLSLNDVLRHSWVCFGSEKCEGRVNDDLAELSASVVKQLICCAIDGNNSSYDADQAELLIKFNKVYVVPALEELIGLYWQGCWEEASSATSWQTLREQVRKQYEQRRKVMLQLTSLRSRQESGLAKKYSQDFTFEQSSKSQSCQSREVGVGLGIGAVGDVQRTNTTVHKNSAKAASDSSVNSTPLSDSSFCSNNQQHCLNSNRTQLDVQDKGKQWKQEPPHFSIKNLFFSTCWLKEPPREAR
eukprot:TRINITY_DN110_c0_g1_i1.p2 TRINITY_DN110_c0_g1~~TRINITY_DN110_c0_g1_i1.p2  ORF type:complete len:353 (+),score=28.76 TRINITY_DN110_c0_g1_i1:847-1905(+)